MAQDFEQLEKQIQDLNDRLKPFEDLQKEQEAVGFVPKGVNFKLTSPQSISPGHKHVEADVTDLTHTEPGYIDIELTAGEPITANDAVVFGHGGDATTTEIISDSPSSVKKFGRTSNDFVKVAQSFSGADAPVRFYKVNVKLAKIGSPTDNVELSIQTDSGGPSGTKLATKTIDGSTLTTSYVETTFEFTSAIGPLTGTHHVVLERSGAVSDTDYYGVQATAASVYGNGDFYSNNGSSWSSTAVDFEFLSMVMEMEGDKIYQADANDQDRNHLFAGFATEAITTGATGTVRKEGILSGFTSLTVGPVYMSTTLGSVSATKKGRVRRLGVATSTTEIFIMSEQQQGGVDTLDVDWVNVNIPVSQTDAVGKTYTIPAGLLGPYDGIEMEIAITGTHSDSDDITIQFGGQTIWEADIGAQTIIVSVRVFNRGAVDSQEYVTTSIRGIGGTEALGESFVGALSVNTASAVVLQALFDTAGLGQYNVLGWTIKHIKQEVIG